MNITSRQTVCLGAFLAIIASCWFVLSMTLKAQTEKPRAKTIQLDTDGKHSLQILEGPRDGHHEVRIGCSCSGQVGG